MTVTIIITICILLLLAYIFELSSGITKIPSVIMLLLLGWVTKQLGDMFGVHFPELYVILPVLGTIGLILIVLEGSLELELNRNKLGVINVAFWNALIPMLCLAFIFALLLSSIVDIPYKRALLNVIPFCIISSAIAIPTVKIFSGKIREFVIYESSLSDIIGVLFFNFIAFNESIGYHTFIQFSVELIIIIVISFLAVLSLSFLLSRLNHHITYTPIILIVLLIYAVSKIYHFPGLIFILVFGLFLGNLDEMKHISWINKLKPEKLDKEVKKFKEFTIETTFLIRSLFFILFGFLLKAEEIVNVSTLPFAVGIVLIIILIRIITLRLSKLKNLPLLFFSPRGLITILLYLSILPEQQIPLINKSLIIQTIILTVLFMMFGLMTIGKNENYKTL